MTGELIIGAATASILLSVILRIVYNTVELPNKAKPLIAIGIGIALGVLALFYAGTPATFRVVVDYCVAGFLTGATAVGFYEITQRG